MPSNFWKTRGFVQRCRRKLFSVVEDYLSSAAETECTPQKGENTNDPCPLCDVTAGLLVQHLEVWLRREVPILHGECQRRREWRLSLQTQHQYHKHDNRQQQYQHQQALLHLDRDIYTAKKESKRRETLRNLQLSQATVLYERVRVHFPLFDFSMKTLRQIVKIGQVFSGFLTTEFELLVIGARGCSLHGHTGAMPGFQQPFGCTGNDASCNACVNLKLAKRWFEHDVMVRVRGLVDQLTWALAVETFSLVAYHLATDLPNLPLPGNKRPLCGSAAAARARLRLHCGYNSKKNANKPFSPFTAILNSAKKPYPQTRLPKSTAALRVDSETALVQLMLLVQAVNGVGHQPSTPTKACNLHAKTWCNNVYETLSQFKRVCGGKTVGFLLSDLILKIQRQRGYNQKRRQERTNGGEDGDEFEEEYDPDRTPINITRNTGGNNDNKRRRDRGSRRSNKRPFYSQLPEIAEMEEEGIKRRAWEKLQGVNKEDIEDQQLEEAEINKLLNECARSVVSTYETR